MARRQTCAPCAPTRLACRIQGCPHGRAENKPSIPVGVMPAKGAMDRTVEAPASEPLSSQRDVKADLRGVTRRFGEVIAVEDLSLSVRDGEIAVVVGPSGCGKSTLLEILAGLQEPDAGSAGAERAAYMPQRDLLLPWRNALANAALALECAGVSPRDARAQ